jgi:hypothetical protein
VSRLAALAVLLVASPAAAASDDLSPVGRLAVGVTTRTFVDASRGRTLVTEVWYPARTAGRDTRLRHGRWRLVLYLAHARRYRRILTSGDAAAQGSDVMLTARPR